jgi:hypothetical protein
MGIENIVKKFLTKPFSKTKGDLQPVELISALKNEMDNGVQVMSESRCVAPNKFVLSMNLEDYNKIASWGADAFISEIRDSLVQYAKSQNYSLLGNIEIVFQRNVEYPKGDFSIDAIAIKEAVAPATAKVDSHPSVTVNDHKYILTANKTIIGRGESADIVIPDKNISKIHLSIEKLPDKFLLEDLNSTNGTLVEGNRVEKAYLLDGNIITLGNTNILFNTGDKIEY